MFKCSLCQQFEHTDRTAGTGARVQDTRIATRFYAPTVHKLSVGLVDTYKLIKKKRHEVRRDDIFHTEEVIMDRYEIKRQLGQGSFGQVVEASDKETGCNVAVKIIRSKSMMAQAKIEIKLLNLLKGNDPDDSSGTVQLLDTFVYKGHQCLVFELLSANLDELLRNTSFRGISLNLTRKFARQVLRTLSFLSRLPKPIIHCDLKPENIALCHPRRSAIKVIDFGSACCADDRMYSYIQSRFYRAPEVMMRLPYGVGVDMWSLGCILVEMHTGEPLFTGKSTHDQMRRIIEMFGMVPRKMLDTSPSKYRDSLFVKTDGQFVFNHKATTDKTPEGGKEEAGPRSLDGILGAAIGGPQGRRKGEAGHRPADYAVFLDLIESMLQLDPALRISPEDALLTYSARMHSNLPPL